MVVKIDHRILYEILGKKKTPKPKQTKAHIEN